MNGGRPQFCPCVLNSSGGAPTARSLRHDILPCPAVRSIRIYTNRQVLHQRQMTAAARHLLIQQPLHPLMKINPGAVLVCEIDDCPAFGVMQRFRPTMPAGPMLFHQCTVGCISVPEAVLWSSQNCREQRIARKTEPQRVQNFHLQLKDTVPVNHPLTVQSLRGSREFFKLRSSRRTRNPVHVQPQGI